MNPPNLRLAVSLALASGLVMTGCKSTDTGETDSDTETDSQDTDTFETQLVGTTPEGLAVVCAAAGVHPWLQYISLPDPVDFLAVRAVTDMGVTEREERYTLGTPCATATDVDACTATLDETWPGWDGWGYCGEGCTQTGLVTTLGDAVGLHERTDQVAALFGEIDVPAEALYLSVTSEYSPECASLVETEAGDWRFRATIMTSDCEVTYEVRELEVRRDGTLAVLQTIETIETDACIGRRPDGLMPCAPPPPASAPHGLGERLARMAWLEASAVVAFERVAADLARLGAPPELITRAHAAAADEVAHAAQVGAIAAAYGGTVPAVEVAPHVERSAVEIALENAVEGCVFETFGVVDAAYRAHHAATPELRALYAQIAEDEQRHAELSWAIGAWLHTRLTRAERAAVADAVANARAELLSRCAFHPADAVNTTLGAPPAAVATVMAERLHEALAA